MCIECAKNAVLRAEEEPTIVENAMCVSMDTIIIAHGLRSVSAMVIYIGFTFSSLSLPFIFLLLWE